MRRLSLVAAALALLLGLSAAPAWAGVDRIPVSGISYPTGTVFDPGVRWVSGNTRHIRDWSYEMRVLGTAAEGNQYMDGYLVLDSLNNNINCLTGTGIAWGDFTWTSDQDPNSGWIGTSVGDYSGVVCGPTPNMDFESTSRSVAIGFGQFEGLQLRMQDVYEGEFPRYGAGYVTVLP